MREGYKMQAQNNCFIGCEESFEKSSAVLFGAGFDGTTSFNVDDVSFTYVPPSGNTLTVNKVGAGNVTLTLDKVSYENTDSETLTAVAATHWNFANWSGDLTGSTNPETLVMDADKTVTANFTIDPTFNYAFNFDTDGDLEGWTMDPKVVVKSHTGGLVTLTLEADQWSRLNLFDFPIPATTTDTNKYNKVTVVVKNEEATTNQFGVTLGANNETRVYPLLSQAAFQTFEINLTEFTDWTGDVTSLRVRFADENNTAKTGRPSASHDIVIDSIVFSFDASILSTKDNVIENFSFYPNPAKNIINFSNTKNSVSKVQIFNIYLQQGNWFADINYRFLFTKYKTIFLLNQIYSLVVIGQLRITLQRSIHWHFLVLLIMILQTN